MRGDARASCARGRAARSSRWVSSVSFIYSVATVHTWRYQRAAKSQVEQMVSIERPPAARVAVPDAAKPLKSGELIGRVDIPRLKLSAAVAEGDDDKTLGKAVGHLPDTPLPWQRRGNVALAAHRDGLFRQLEKIRLDDDVRLVTTRGEYPLSREEDAHRRSG